MRQLRACLAAALALAALPAAPAPDKARTYALVAAVGEEFNLVHEVQSTGTHLAPYRRSTAHAGQNVMNRLVLHSLDKAIAGLEPDSKRLYFAIDVPKAGSTQPAQRERGAIDNVVRELEKMPERTQWDRIVVITPAYSALSQRGLASRLAGLGVFTQPLCQDFSAGSREGCEFGLRGANGPEAQTPQGDTVHANQYVAPFSYLEIWVLDPASLNVLDRRAVLESQKLIDPLGPANLSQNLPPEFLAARIVSLVDVTVQEAVRASELRGTVEVGEVKPVDSGKAPVK